jgi:hypothetical protein
MSESKFDSFEEFWPHYVRAHSQKSNRMLHFGGTTLALGALALGLSSRRRRWMLALAPVVGYGPAWIGHFLVEGNVPATFGHPLWSLRADLRMYGKMLAGTMDDEVDRVTAEAAREPASDEHSGSNGGSNGAGAHGSDELDELDELRNRSVN